MLISGAREYVEGAKKRLLEIVAELEAMTEIQCIIPQKHHRAILGNKGKNVQDLTSRLNVQIKFPERRRNEDETPVVDEPPVEEGQENKNDIIMISGNRERAEEAKNALMVSFLFCLKIGDPMTMFEDGHSTLVQF